MKNTVLTLTALATLAMGCHSTKPTTDTTDTVAPKIEAHEILGESSGYALGPFKFGMSLDEVKGLAKGTLTNDDDEMISYTHKIHHIEMTTEYWFEEGYGLVDIDVILATTKEEGPGIYEDLADHIWMKYGRDQDHGDHLHATWEEDSDRGDTSVRIDDNGTIILDISHWEY